MDLHPKDFADFFCNLHGYDPFPWQQALVDQIADSDSWPDVLKLPTGSGKTAALDAALFHLALRAHTPNKAALRIIFVVDRRLVVDDAFVRAKRMAKILHDSLTEGAGGNSVLKEIAQRLQRLAGKDGPPLVAQRLRGGAPLEHDWARTPTQPTILCSTVDQVGSRLLFRGYGVSDRMKPVHAGLLGVNSLILLDEVHIAEPFRQTLEAVGKVGQARFKFALLSATPGKKADHPFTLTAKDRDDPTLSKRLEASKPARLKLVNDKDIDITVKEFTSEAQAMAKELQKQNIPTVAVGVIVNRVALARRIFQKLDSKDLGDTVLLIGRSRNVDRDEIVNALAPFRTGKDRCNQQSKSLFVVATQCLEVGVDLDLDGLVTQAAPLDALRQRFGRLNRAGRSIQAQGAILALKKDVAGKADDPVYGDRIRSTWEVLKKIADGKKVDFGVESLSFEALSNALKELSNALKEKELPVNPDDLASEQPDAPVLMPAYLDLWSQTSPQPTAAPDIGLFLHGVQRMAAGVSVVWRSDISENDLEEKTGVNLKEIIRLVPPRAGEAVELALWVAREWLLGSENAHLDLSDVPEREEKQGTGHSTGKRAFRWAGYDNPDTGIVSANDLRVGDLLVVPAEYGGCDRFGWAPESDVPVADVADKAAKPYWKQRCAVRVAPDIMSKESSWKYLSNIFASENIDSPELVERLLSAISSDLEQDKTNDNQTLRSICEPLKALRCAKERIIDLHFPYAGGRKGGVILVAEKGVSEAENVEMAIPTTEDDGASHTSSRPVLLDDHGCHVARFAKCFAQRLGLHEEIVKDLELAAFLHDAGKADPRFQTMLTGGDPWNRPEGPPLAKSGRSWSPQIWERSGLPKGWRHEALSVRMAQAHPRFAEAHDRKLVLWLIGTHHGLGRPLFNFCDPEPEQDLPPCLDVDNWKIPVKRPGPQSLAFYFDETDGADWPSLFVDLKRKYGMWTLAHLEAILRLADHRASEEERA